MKHKLTALRTARNAQGRNLSSPKIVLTALPKRRSVQRNLKILFNVFTGRSSISIATRCAEFTSTIAKWSLFGRGVHRSQEKKKSKEMHRKYFANASSNISRTAVRLDECVFHSMSVWASTEMCMRIVLASWNQNEWNNRYQREAKCYEESKHTTKEKPKDNEMWRSN